MAKAEDMAPMVAALAPRVLPVVAVTASFLHTAGAVCGGWVQCRHTGGGKRAGMDVAHGTSVFPPSPLFAMRNILLLASLWAAAAAHAATDLAAAADIVKANGCYSCHSVAEKIVGPAFSSVAEKYAGDQDAVATLAQSIQMGSKGKWGRAAMPAHSSLSAQDLKLLASWVLSAKP